jgi:hypothetical protein
VLLLLLLLLQDLSGKVFSAVMLQGANLANSSVVGSQVSIACGMQTAVCEQRIGYADSSFPAAALTAGQQQGGGQPGERGVCVECTLPWTEICYKESVLAAAMTAGQQQRFGQPGELAARPSLICTVVNLIFLFVSTMHGELDVSLAPQSCTAACTAK